MVKKEKKGVTDHEFHRMEQWLTLVTSDKARENDRRMHREAMEKIRRLQLSRERTDESTNNPDEPQPDDKET